MIAADFEMHTERTFIRRLQSTDLYDYFILYSDAEAMRFREQKPFEKPEDAETALQEVENDFISRKKFRFGIEWKENKQLIGTFLIKDVSDDSCMIGYSLHKNYWRKGIMTEVCSVMIQFLFDEIHCKFLFATVKEGNARSVHLLQKLHFIFFKKDENNLLYYQLTQKQNPH